MASLRDGLGGEELQISGLQAGGVTISPFIVGSLTTTSQISGLNVYGQFSGGFVRVTSTDVIGTTSLSGLNVFAQGSGLFGRVTNANGVLFPVTMGSPGAFGALIQAGSLGTDAGSLAFLALRQVHANTAYAVILTPFSGGSIAAWVSGVQNATSGVNVVGGPSNRYYWLTVGL